MQILDRSNLEKIAAVVELRRASKDVEKQWELIHELHQSSSSVVHKHCIAKCKSDDPLERTIAADILGQLGCFGKDNPFREKSIPALIPLLKDPDENVVDASITAISHLQMADEILSCLELAKHDSNLIRLSMARCLGFVDSPKARRVLIKLSRDNDDDVRNWATFGLGSQCENNTKEIRAALYDRLNDDDEETRNEAILGLARRKILDVLPALLQELSAKPADRSPLATESARELLEPLREMVTTTEEPNQAVKNGIKEIEKFLD